MTNEQLTGGPMNTPPDVNAYPPAVIQTWYNKLREYEEAMSEGRLAVLPCKVGDTVYEITQGYCDDEDCPDEYYDYVDDVYIDVISYKVFGDGETEIKLNEYLRFDQTFPTREEAEAALVEGDQSE